MEIRSPPSALKQTTDYWKAKKYNTETREDAATLRVPHCYDRTISRMKLGRGARNTYGGGHPLYSSSTSDPRPGRLNKDEDSL